VLKPIAALWFTLLFVFPAVGKAAYIIKLKNGNQFIIDRYWHEGRQVMFDTYGGVFGIDRSFVVKIEESNKPLKLTSTVESSVEARSHVASKEEKESKKASLPSAGQKFETKRDENPILRDFDALKEKVKGLNGMLTTELQEFSKNLTELKRRIQLSGKSNDYLREFAEISEMGDMVETALKSRR
jgi:hypothetical protein